MNPTVGERAASWAAAALSAAQREYPNAPHHTTQGDDDRPTPRQAHPAFYGSFDWHSCVEMHWVLVRLLRVAPDAVPGPDIRRVLDSLLTVDALQVEVDYLTAHPSWERPYGWGWALTLAAELRGWDDPDANRWAIAVRPLADAITAAFVDWLPKLSHPVRHGVHANTAFALSRSRDYASRYEPALLEAIDANARRWFAQDVDYPGRYEPCGTDFLSGALCEAQLMAQVMPAADVGEWLARFLPDLSSGRPEALFTPVRVVDESDGQLAHLHGLNVSRAWCWSQLAAVLPVDDVRRAPMLQAADRHRDASLDRATGSDYMVEHWLAAYAVLLLT